jgi:hypothetical protein
MSLASANREVWETHQVKALITNCGHQSSVDAQPGGYY